MTDLLPTEFSEIFSSPPKHLIRTPGRINLIGDHTDYNAGLALPMAIDRHLTIVFSKGIRKLDQASFCFAGPSQRHSVNISLTNLGDEKDFGDHGPRSYIKATLLAFQKKLGRVLSKGFNAVVSSRIPIGRGLSSSAALCCALVRTFATVEDVDLEDREIIEIAWQAEHDFLGVACGLMDQTICCRGKKDHATMIDFDSGRESLIRLPEEVKWIVIDTKIKRELASSGYNERREECQKICHHFKVDSIRHLATTAGSAIRASQLTPTLQKRLEHVQSENLRVRKFCQALSNHRFSALGAIMNESHESLSQLYEVSTPVVDEIAKKIRNHPKCLGVRMTGGGFGGCLIAAVETKEADRFVDEIEKSFSPSKSMDPDIFAISTSLGQQLIHLEGLVKGSSQGN